MSEAPGGGPGPVKNTVGNEKLVFSLDEAGRMFASPENPAHRWERQHPEAAMIAGLAHDITAERSRYLDDPSERQRAEYLSAITREELDLAA